MRTNLIMAGALALGLSATGCATKKYVAKTVAPVEARVTATEGQNTKQDQEIATNSKDINEVQTSLSRTNERVTDVDTKATAANAAAARANDAAVAAQRTASGAQTAADGAKTAADDARAKGIARANEVQTVVEKKVDAVNKYQMATSETVLFAVNQSVLDKDAMAKLDNLASRVGSAQRYIIEVQGFTDKTGSAQANEILSQKRAEAVTRYLVNEHKIQVRNIDAIGSGYALPVADDKTRDGRAQNRRVEVRLYTPEMDSAVTIAGN
jgi:outer membrane protein OmpA-like peptidoglycan-associated protein